VVACELFWSWFTVDVFEKLFGLEVFGMPLVYVVDGSVEEAFVSIYYHSVQWSGSGVLWVRDVVDCGNSWSLWEFRCIERGAR
jgi:hypothetical protein